MIRLIRDLVRPYRGSLTVILLAMLVQTMMSLAGPWPLKVIIDNVAAGHRLEPWIAHLLKPLLTTGSKMQIVLGAAAASVVIALLGALASYVANYYSTSVGQYVARDLLLRTYQHLQRLSLKYYSEHEVGKTLSTITTDIQTIQAFASSSTLAIVVDTLTIAAMLVLMFWMNWDFTLIALAVTPFLIVHQDQDVVDAALSVGASGYVTKSDVTTDLVPAIREALQGRRYLSPSIRP